MGRLKKYNDDDGDGDGDAGKEGRGGKGGYEMGITEPHSAHTRTHTYTKKKIDS